MASLPLRRTRPGTCYWVAAGLLIAAEIVGAHRARSICLRNSSSWKNDPRDMRGTKKSTTSIFTPVLKVRYLGKGVSPSIVKAWLWRCHLLTTAKLCPPPHPITRTREPWSLATTPGRWILISSPVPQIPCSFQPQVITEPQPRIERVSYISTSVRKTEATTSQKVRVRYKWHNEYKWSHRWTNLKKIETDCSCGFWNLVSLTVFKFIFVVCNVWYNAWETYLFDTNRWSCHLQVISPVS